MTSRKSNEGLDINGAVGSLDVLGVPIAQPDEGVDFGSLGFLVPGGDDQESSNDVPVDEEVQEAVGSVDVGLVEKPGTPQVVPVSPPDFLVDCGHNHRDVSLLPRVPTGIELTVLTPAWSLSGGSLGMSDGQEGQRKDHNKGLAH